MHACTQRDPRRWMTMCSYYILFMQVKIAPSEYPLFITLDWYKAKEKMERNSLGGKTEW